MYIIREIMYCKPGKVRPLVEKFLAMSALSKRIGMPGMRVLTDFAGEAYWTVVAEMEVGSIQEFETMMSGGGSQGSKDDMKEMDKIMSGYHDLVDHGKREIFKLESPA